MTIIRKKELTSTPKAELVSKLNELRKELMKLNAQVARGTNPKNPRILRETKKTIAKIIFVLSKKTKVKQEVKQKHE